MDTPIKASYVKTEFGRFYVQLPANNEWGFELASDDQTWAGGIGCASEWELVADSEVPAEIQERLGWLLEELNV